jgi:4'-phosphopantetheinyl transferase
MNLTAFSEIIRCTFNPEKVSSSSAGNHKTEIFFTHKSDFSLLYPALEKHFNNDDLLKAGRLRNTDDRSVTLTCYTLLRHILSGLLKIKPEEISYFINSHGKPEIKNSSLHFNLSHSKDAFAIAISESVNVGVDLEKQNIDLNYKAIVKRFFSEAESKYILFPEEQSLDRFFLLWTRKEAFLKAIGTGIISDLSHVEVFRPVNPMDKKVIDPLSEFSVSDDYFIYSFKHCGYYLSVALPQESDLIFTHLDEDYIKKNLV